MRICIDPGHGFENKSPNIYDPGATITCVGTVYRESAINLDVARILDRNLRAAGHETMLTRQDEKQSCPVTSRAPKAQAWAADLLVSLHCNAAETPFATGVEIEYRDEEDRELADIMLPYLMRASGLPDHGNDERVGLAVLKFAGPAILVEMGFLTCDLDRAILMDPGRRGEICRAVVEAIGVWRPKRVAAKPAPRVCPTCNRPL